MISNIKIVLKEDTVISYEIEHGEERLLFCEIQNL